MRKCRSIVTSAKTSRGRTGRICLYIPNAITSEWEEKEEMWEEKEETWRKKRRRGERGEEEEFICMSSSVYD